MELHYSIKELTDIQVRVDRAIQALQEQGTIISTEHNLMVIAKLIEENKALREELIRRSSNEH